MKITLIDKENEKYFQPFMTDVTDSGTKDLLRIGALDDEGNIAGALAAQTDMSEVDIVSIYVDPGYRNQGYGRLMVETLLGLVPDAGTYRFLVHFNDEDGLRPFFGHMGFEIVKDMELKYVTFIDACMSPLCRKQVLGRKAESIHFISELDAFRKNMLSKYMLKKGYSLSTSYDPEFSSVGIGAGKITSIMLADTDGRDVSVLWMDFLPSCQKELFDHINLLLNRMNMRHFEDDARIFFVTQNAKFTDILIKLSMGSGYARKEADHLYGVRILDNSTD